MKDLTILILCLMIIMLLVLFRIIKGKHRSHYNSRGFDHNHIHKNGTKYDDLGYDYFGYDINGFNRHGYDVFGKNQKGQYDRFFDTKSGEEEGFLSPQKYPIGLTNHACQRFQERLGICDLQKMKLQAIDAYRFGKSKRQIKRTTAYLIDEIEGKHENSIVLIYRNFIYVFSTENILITVYKNDRMAI